MFSVSDSVNHLLWSSWQDMFTHLGEVDWSAEKERAGTHVKAGSVAARMKSS